ncbi:hypothetical protein ACRALDRAFT_205217 [Sodiomyces alcalophilus JCM 7366]|uniref:uncharacterized protein n=1 Tax=Sodiomyces alcalophilus JCM 7366 TaxID=591952 RepID=UPI0039B68293
MQHSQGQETCLRVLAVQSPGAWYHQPPDTTHENWICRMSLTHRRLPLFAEAHARGNRLAYNVDRRVSHPDADAIDTVNGSRPWTRNMDPPSQKKSAISAKETSKETYPVVAEALYAMQHLFLLFMFGGQEVTPTDNPSEARLPRQAMARNLASFRVSDFTKSALGIVKLGPKSPDKSKKHNTPAVLLLLQRLESYAVSEADNRKLDPMKSVRRQTRTAKVNQPIRDMIRPISCGGLGLHTHLNDIILLPHSLSNTYEIRIRETPHALTLSAQSNHRVQRTREYRHMTDSPCGPFSRVWPGQIGKITDPDFPAMPHRFPYAVDVTMYLIYMQRTSYYETQLHTCIQNPNAPGAPKRQPPSGDRYDNVPPSVPHEMVHTFSLVTSPHIGNQRNDCIVVSEVASGTVIRREANLRPTSMYISACCRMSTTESSRFSRHPVLTTRRDGCLASKNREPLPQAEQGVSLGTQGLLAFIASFISSITSYPKVIARLDFEFVLTKSRGKTIGSACYEDDEGFCRAPVGQVCPCRDHPLAGANVASLWGSLGATTARHTTYNVITLYAVHMYTTLQGGQYPTLVDNTGTKRGRREYENCHFYPDATLTRFPLLWRRERGIPMFCETMYNDTGNMETSGYLSFLLLFALSLSFSANCHNMQRTSYNVISQATHRGGWDDTNGARV